MLFLFLASCGGPSPDLRPEGPYWYDADDRDIPEPESADPLLAWQSLDRTVFHQWEQLADIERNARIIFGDREESWNINAFDEVPNCSWFTNRHHLHPMTPEEIERGVDITGGPDTAGTWTLFRPKVGGATPGFWIKDSRGTTYIIKFDPIANPEMATAAAAMASRFFHAAGYNVPEETIVYWRPEQLTIKAGLEFTDRDGVRRPFTQDDLDDILERVYHEPDGRIRSLASLALPDVKGPFSYTGTRADDPNDWCPHEHRRELRGLYVPASLVNHYDTKDQNSLDAYVTEGDRRFLRHYLIDFGSAFGSNGDRPKGPTQGYCNTVDVRSMFVSLLTLGLKKQPWEHEADYEFPSVGYFEAERFEPKQFEPIVPNPAFENLTARDGYWGAKIVTAFRDRDLRAVVRAGRLSDPGAEEYLVQTLIARRDKIGRYWFGKINPLDYFEERYEGTKLIIEFDDLAVKYGLEPAEEATYRYAVTHRGSKVIDWEVLGAAEIHLDAPRLDRLIETFRFEPENPTKSHLYALEIETSRNGDSWSKPARVWLWYFPGEERFAVVGIEHVD